MRVYSEFVCQVLDTISFVLVVPEILGEEKLLKIRSNIKTLSVKTGYEDLRLSGLSWVIAALVCMGWAYMTLAMTTGESYTINTEVVDHKNIIAAGQIILLTIGQILFLLFTSSLLFAGLLRISQIILFRKIMFGLGAILFFLARGFSLYRSWVEGS